MDRNNNNRGEKRAEKYESALENFKSKQVPATQPKKKTRWISLVVLLASIAIGVVLVVGMSSEMGDSQKGFVDTFSVVSAQNALFTIAALAAILLLDVGKFLVIINATTKKFRPSVSAKVSLWGRYYDNITPSASGGQPAQIIYLHGKGFSAGLATAVVFIKYFVNTLVWVAVGGIAMATNTSVLQNVSNGNLLKIAGWVGWTINMLLPLAILSFVLTPKLATKLARGLINLGYKMKIIKDREKMLQKALNAVQDFRSSFIIISKRPLHLALLILICAAEIFLSFGFPYFIIRMFNGYSVEQLNFATFYSVMGLNAYANFGASLIPTPGGSGAIEGLLTVAFSGMAGDTLMWVTFTYRFAVFYIYILIGLGITIFNFVRGVVRARKGIAAAAEAKPTTDDADNLSSSDGKRIVVEFDEKK